MGKSKAPDIWAWALARCASEMSKNITYPFPNFNMPSKVWDEIAYPFPNLNGVSNFIPYFIMDVITYPCISVGYSILRQSPATKDDSVVHLSTITTKSCISSLHGNKIYGTGLNLFACQPSYAVVLYTRLHYENRNITLEELFLPSI